MKRPFLVAFVLVVLAGCAAEGPDAGTDVRGWPDQLKVGGAAYDRGDYATALKEFRPLAEQGNADAQFNLGFMYENGLGVPQDYAEAVKWYRNAAEGQASAQYNLGNMYREGRGVPQDDAEAAKWYRKAAEQNRASGQENLGVSYAEGRGVPQDYVQALMWLNLAAEQDKDAVKNRDDLAKRATPEQIAEAQRLAREWIAAFEKRKNE